MFSVIGVLLFGVGNGVGWVGGGVSGVDGLDDVGVCCREAPRDVVRLGLERRCGPRRWEFGKFIF